MIAANSTNSVLIALALVFSFACSERESPVAGRESGTQPNLLVVIADDLGLGDVSSFGGSIETPHLDRLAEQGVKLERFYAEPQCSQTRAALLTGRPPAAVGIGASVVRPWEEGGLDSASVTLAEWLRAAGYRTCLIGKWHLGHARPAYHPNAHGFDHFYGHLLGAVNYYSHERLGGLDWQRNGRSVRERGYSTDLLAAEAVRWLRADEGKEPFFLTVAFNAVHTPLQAPPGFESAQRPEPGRGGAKLARRAYSAVVASLDARIGEILAALDDLGVGERTLVLFLSDNGPADARFAESLVGLRGGKGTVYEGGLRVPAIARWSGVLEPGRSHVARVRAGDWFPTVAEAFELALPAVDLEGRSFWADLKSGRTTPEADARPMPFATSSRSGNYRALVEGNWKLVERDSVVEGAAATVRELFDLAADPRELRNLAPAQPERVAGMRTVLAEWVGTYQVTFDDRSTPPEGWKAPSDWAAAAASD